jgi:acyl carrier protein
MRELTIEELRRIMRECAGEDESVNLDGDVSDTAFSDLGYDSLAMMETAAKIEREFGLQLPEDMAAVETPRAFLTVVNHHLNAMT